MICQPSYSQNSVLINFGSTTCSSIASPALFLIKNPLSGAPMILTSCDLSGQLAGTGFIFTAYNPRNNKIYVADIGSGETKIWLLDIGLPANIECPPVIPATPDYTYSYVSNNFEFDNNGDLWSLSNYDDLTGQCSIDKFDVATGSVINTRLVQFPAGEFPTTIASGDVTILPNGRMFAALGSGPCRLYEITGYNSTTGNASAIYLQTLPMDCFGVAYLNGMLELTGTDFSNCYYYDYNIATNTLGTEKPFQNGQLPIDNSSFTPSVGCTKRLLGATLVNSNTADLVYEVHQENLGNVRVNNVNLVDDLGAAFGPANVSNVSVNFVPGSNEAGLVLDPTYNGITNTDILNAGQNLPNNVSTSQDYFFTLLIHCRVTNLNNSVTYLNAAVASGDIGGDNALTLVSVADSSNNGDSTFVDPNHNANAGDVGENTPTPFSFGLLPVKFLNIEVSWLNKKDALVQWQVATPADNAARFEVEYSLDRSDWQRAGAVPVLNHNRGDYDFSHLNVPAGNIYYRVKQTDNDGTFTYSKIVMLHSKANGNAYVIYPNPANDFISVSAGYSAGRIQIDLYDATGRKLLTKLMAASTEDINTAKYPTGTYFLKIAGEEAVITYKVIVKH